VSDDAVLWHDLECGGYAEDLPLWRALADDEAGDDPVVDVGAGTGRVALDLARHGHDVLAVDAEAVLLDALRDRAAAEGLAVEAVVADARRLDLGDRRFGLVIVPMQTVQLFGPEGRLGFLARAHAHLRPEGVLALAIADARDSVADERTEPPLPDLREVGGVVYSSRPVVLRDEGPGVAIERLREVVTRSGERTASTDVVRLDHLDAATLEDEARAVGLRPLPRRIVPQTDEYVGSAVVILGG
jgi:SAM-dependent methyltransferase